MQRMQGCGTPAADRVKSYTRRGWVGAGLVWIALMIGVPTTRAQAPVILGGRAFVDYLYIASDPDTAQEGLHGFQYRRLYLTADFRLSDQFSGRARLEAAADAPGQTPTPFVKDLYLRWHDAWAQGHDMALGVMPPPAFTVSEDVWGYRSLAKTILDQFGVVSSRDFALAADGPLLPGGALQYAVMYANNSGVRAEADRYKRLYAQLQWFPSEQLHFTLGGDYAGYGDARKGAVTLNAFAGYTDSVLRAGLESFWHRPRHMVDSMAIPRFGASLFTTVRVQEPWELVLRTDLVRQHADPDSRWDYFAIVGLAYYAHDHVLLIPNLVWEDNTDQEAHVTGRFTLFFSF